MKKKEEAIEIMEEVEAKELESIMNRNGTETLNFWKIIKQIKRKEEGEEIIENEEEIKEKDKNKILEIKKKYYI